MIENIAVKPVLVFTYGNPSRGDDSLGPVLFDMLMAEQRQNGAFSHVEVLTDFQLQVEHALDLQQRERVLFVDASMDAHPPYEFHPLTPQQDFGYTTHAMSPAALLSVYQQVHRQLPCPAFMLSIRGYAFGLGQALSPPAHGHLVTAYDFVSELLVSETDEWVAHAASAA